MSQNMAVKEKERLILSWLEEDIDSDQNDSVCSNSDAPTEQSEHNSDTEQSNISDIEDGQHEIMETDNIDAAAHEDLISVPRASNMQVGLPLVYVGKDPHTKWLIHKLLPVRSKTNKENIIKHLPGVKGVAKGKDTILDCWKIFFPEEIIQKLVEYTNQELEKMSHSYSRGLRDCPLTDFEELTAFFGVLYLLGIKKANHAHTSEMWATDGTAADYFRAVMSERRFHILVRALRFDDKDTRKERSKLDNLAAIRDIFDMFVNRCVESYSPGEYVTIDEMLEAFRGKCKFRQYIGNKPDKYGIKIFALVDSRTFYTVKMEVYCGKQPLGPFKVENDSSSVVKRLLEPIDKTGRNLTTDNYYTSIPLANDLYINHRITMVGTIRKNKPQLPQIFKDVKNRPVCSSLFGFKSPPNQTLLLSYVPKKNKNVLLISTFHSEDIIDPDSYDSLKPEVITFYNLTKGGVDVVDRMKKEYSVKRISNRWPMTLFNGLLNLGTINSQIIHKANTNTIIPRRKYISELAKQLATPHLLRRSSIENLSSGLKQAIRNVTGQELPRRNEAPGTPGIFFLFSFAIILYV